MKTSRVIPIMFVVPILLFAACAGMNVTQISTAADDNAARGVRYYGTSPYLLVHTDSKGGIVADLKYLPDTKKKMSAQPYNYLASNATTLQFDRGVLTSSSVEVDETVVPAATIAALKDLAIAAVKAGAGLGIAQASDKPEAPMPVLFKIVINEEGPQLWGPAGSVSMTGIHVQKTAKE